MALDGTNVVLLANTGTPSVPVWSRVAAQKNVQFSEDTAEIDASSKDDGQNATFIPGRNSATIALEHLREVGDAGFAALRSAKRNRQLILVRRQEFGNDLEEANALVTNISDSYPDSEAGTVSIALRVSGAWSPAV